MVQGVAIVKGEVVCRNPATGEEIVRVPVSRPEQVDAAIATARSAQPGWQAVPLAQRISTLKCALRELRDGDMSGLAKLVTLEMGKVLEEAQAEVSGAVDKDAFLALIQQANEPVQVLGSVIYREAHGVVALCTPWNFPVDEILLLALPALAAGNTVVVKPSEVTPLSGAATVNALRRGLSAAGHEGVCQLLQGDGEVGARLVSHPDVSLVAMTGSSATGSRIMGACASGLKRLVLELGGKDPMVVFSDADLELAAKDAVSGSLTNTGQVCSSVERVYVASSVRDEFCAKVVEEARQWVSGPGLDACSKIGPLVSDMQRQLVHKHVLQAEAAGATVALGGRMPPPSARGYFYPATVLFDVPQQAMREETFGPVVSIATFDDTEEMAVRLANDSEYGLSASVYTQDLAKAKRVGLHLKAGQVGINNNPLDTAPLECPWAGHKRSGFGYHSGADGWRQFSVPKSLIAVPGTAVGTASVVDQAALTKRLSALAAATALGMAIGMTVGVVLGRARRGS